LVRGADGSEPASARLFRRGAGIRSPRAVGFLSLPAALSRRTVGPAPRRRSGSNRARIVDSLPRDPVRRGVRAFACRSAPLAISDRPGGGKRPVSSLGSGAPSTARGGGRLDARASRGLSSLLRVGVGRRGSDSEPARGTAPEPSRRRRDRGG